MDFLKQTGKIIGEGLLVSGGIIAVAMFATVGFKIGEKMGDEVSNAIFQNETPVNQDTID